MLACDNGAYIEKDDALRIITDWESGHVPDAITHSLFNEVCSTNLDPDNRGPNLKLNFKKWDLLVQLKTLIHLSCRAKKYHLKCLRAGSTPIMNVWQFLDGFLSLTKVCLL